jgi:hypothetical protein
MRKCHKLYSEGSLIVGNAASIQSYPDHPALAYRVRPYADFGGSLLESKKEAVRVVERPAGLKRGARADASPKARRSLIASAQTSLANPG